MKIRNGFVSNSSSSSFTVLVKNGAKLNKKSLLEIFGVDKKSPLYFFAEELASFIIGNTEPQTIDDLYDNYCGEDAKTMEEKISELVDNYSGFNKEELEKVSNGEYFLFEGSVCNDSGEAFSNYLYESSIDIETDAMNIKVNN